MKPSFLVFLASTAVQANPSFDCRKASTIVEKMICADQVVSKMDSAMAAAYKSALQLGDDDDNKRLRSDQIAWTKARNSCSDSACLRTMYLVRVREICGNLRPDDKLLACSSPNIVTILASPPRGDGSAAASSSNESQHARTAQAPSRSDPLLVQQEIPQQNKVALKCTGIQFEKYLVQSGQDPLVLMNEVSYTFEIHLAAKTVGFLGELGGIKMDVFTESAFGWSIPIRSASGANSEQLRVNVNRATGALTTNGTGERSLPDGKQYKYRFEGEGNCKKVASRVI